MVPQDKKGTSMKNVKPWSEFKDGIHAKCMHWTPALKGSQSKRRITRQGYSRNMMLQIAKPFSAIKCPAYQQAAWDYIKKTWGLCWIKKTWDIVHFVELWNRGSLAFTSVTEMMAEWEPKYQTYHK